LGGHFELQMAKMLVKTIVTVEKLPHIRHKVHSLEVHEKWSFSCVFLLLGRADMAQHVFLWPFLAPNGSNAHRNHSNFPLTTRNIDTKFIH
jgi:hypothetical protein